MAFANLGYGFAADEFSAPPILLITGLIFIAVVLALTAGPANLAKYLPHRAGSTGVIRQSAQSLSR